MPQAGEAFSIDILFKDIAQALKGHVNAI